MARIDRSQVRKVRTVDELVNGVNIHFIDLEHLKQNKRAVGRLQDLADLEKLG